MPLFDRCAECQRCCHVDAGYGPLEVTLTEPEKQRFGSVCIETQCAHLSATGCSLGDSKPFACLLYPLSYDPHLQTYSLDADCPLTPDYLQDFVNPASAAGRHLRQSMQTIIRLETSDPAFLVENHAIDSEFFELTHLPVELLVDTQHK